MAPKFLFLNSLNCRRYISPQAKAMVRPAYPTSASITWSTNQGPWKLSTASEGTTPTAWATPTRRAATGTSTSPSGPVRPSVATASEPTPTRKASMESEGPSPTSGGSPQWVVYATSPSRWASTPTPATEVAMPVRRSSLRASATPSRVAATRYSASATRWSASIISAWNGFQLRVWACPRLRRGRAAAP